MVIILGDQGNKLVVLGNKGALLKVKHKFNFKGKASILFDFFEKTSLASDPLIKCNLFIYMHTSIGGKEKNSE